MAFFVNQKRSSKRNRISRLLRGFRCIIVFQCIALSSPALSQSHVQLGEVSLYPATCTAGLKDRVYLSLGRSVFELPISPQVSGIYVTSVEPDHSPNNPAPTVPTENAGCLGHPLPVASIGLQFSYQRKYGQPVRPGYIIGAFKIQLFKWDDSWKIDNFIDGVTRLNCERASIKEEVPGGLIACLVKPIKPDMNRASVRVEDWGGSYYAEKDTYSNPLGSQFSAWCGPDTYSGHIFSCDLNYLLRFDIRISYKFHPYSTARYYLPVEELVGFDRALRQAIMRLLIDNNG